MIFGPKWPKFHGDSFPEVKRSKFLYIWWVLLIFLILWYKNMTFFFKGQKSEKSFTSQPRLAPPLGGGGSYGTIWYHMVPYGTIRYHMVPYGTIWSPPPQRGGETRLGRKTFFGFLTFEKKGHIFISQNQKNQQNSSNIKEFWPFDLWKRIPMKFRSFWSKNHWKRTILSRVMILFGFKLKIWYHKVPYSTIRYLMVP